MLNRRNEEEVRTWTAEVVRVAKSVLAGSVGVIEGARTLASLGHELGELDQDFIPFVAIHSETDHLPVGSERQHWAADALQEKDAEIERTEGFHRARALVACKRLVERFGQDV